MFTIEDIKSAHAKVQSGADFPQYVRELMQLGVQSYETFVTDGRTNYFGANGFVIESDAKYHNLEIADQPDREAFVRDLKAHQQGHTDYPTFCADCAKSGVEKWMVSLHEKTCTYFDRLNHEVLQEQIPI